MFCLIDFKKSGNYIKQDFITLLTCKWNEIHENCDVFRYKVDSIQEKVIDGYLIQLNPNRSSKRRTPECINNVLQLFDKTKFNFNKVTPKEIIFTLKSSHSDTEVHSVLVNVSPISRFHSLLCPSVNRCLPQVVTEDSLQLVIQLMFLAPDRSFRIGFNSLCALASVNHLHYHLFIENNNLPVETAKCDHLSGPLYCLSNEYPVPAFCFIVSSENAIADTAKDVYKLIRYFLEHSIAHNLFITRGDSIDGEEQIVRVLIWPRKSSAGAKQLTAFNVAVCELSGWFPVYSADDYHKLRGCDLESELKKWKLDNFDSLCTEIKGLY